ncbi:UNVERIFIED_CONTAM: hypothetical protein Scaly_2225100 [Sesamum calycinum]|uniref:O-fucosyltransferase family protein n=1 Tax=Sesamum calycinum TaxID=2727403 RepID=A0AAW2MBL0_9LAMI
MMGRSSFALSRTGSFRPENLGQNALAMVGNLCFTLFVIGVLIFTIIAATYQPDDPLFHPSSKITNFLSSNSIATFKSDVGVVKTAFADVDEPQVVSEARECRVDDPIDDFVILMPKGGKAAAFYKDYRTFTVVRFENCTVSLIGMGEYHSGGNARKRKAKGKGKKEGFEKVGAKVEGDSLALPMVGENVDDALPLVESEDSFSRGKYLIYAGGGDRCKSMHQYLWSFMCMLGEAQYLNRTLVMDLSICLSKIYSSLGVDEEGKDFRFYFDFEHLKDSASVLDQAQFWSEWSKWQRKDGLSLHLVEDFRVTPMKLAEVKDTLIMRKFGSVEPDNYWYRVCEGETESVIQRPWHMIWKSRRLLDVASAISARMNWDFDAVHVERGEKASNKSCGLISIETLNQKPFWQLCKAKLKMEGKVTLLQMSQTRRSLIL